MPQRSTERCIFLSIMVREAIIKALKSVAPDNWRTKYPQRLGVPLLLGLLLCFLAGVDARADGIETAGDVLQIVLPATAAGMTLAYEDGKGALQLGESAALTLGVTYTLKYTVHETRPNGGSNSFPSGHTSISFCSAEFIRKRYGWEYGLPAYAAATFVGYSRVESRNHYTKDVVAGGLIGIGSSYLFTRPYKGWQAQMESDGRYYGIRLSHSW
jgi:membrane-associated phospholipid phosphatase